VEARCQLTGGQGRTGANFLEFRVTLVGARVTVVEASHQLTVGQVTLVGARVTVLEATRQVAGVQGHLSWSQRVTLVEASRQLTGGQGHI
jgi:hypothetical protein